MWSRTCSHETPGGTRPIAGASASSNSRSSSTRLPPVGLLSMLGHASGPFGIKMRRPDGQPSLPAIVVRASIRARGDAAGEVLLGLLGQALGLGLTADEDLFLLRDDLFELGVSELGVGGRFGGHVGGSQS